MSDIDVIETSVDQLKAIAELFDSYRQFYGQSSDLDRSTQFLRERYQLSDSVILAARCNSLAIGFAQLYPTYSSVAMSRVWILNDLFVSPSRRRLGAAKILLSAAKDYAKNSNAVRLVLATAVENLAAKALYEGEGWQQDTVFDHYHYKLY